MIPEHHRRGVATLCLLVGLVTGAGALLESPSVPAGVFFFQAMLLLGIGIIGQRSRGP